MTSYELEFLASERLRERRQEAAHERMAQRIRRPANRPGARPWRRRLTFAIVRRLGRVAEAT